MTKSLHSLQWLYVEVSTEAEPHGSSPSTVTANATVHTMQRFFNIDSKNPNLKCTVSGTYKGNVRTATQTIQLEAAKWYKLNIKTSASGRIDMGISVDDTVEEKPQDVEVNPYL